MVKLEERARRIQAEGLIWGSYKLVPVGMELKKQQASNTVYSRRQSWNRYVEGGDHCF